MITIKIDNKDYKVIAGNRAFASLMLTIGGPAELDKRLKMGAIPFDLMVTCYWDSIPEKGKLTKERLSSYLDQEKDVDLVIITEITAFKKLAEEAKK